MNSPLFLHSLGRGALVLLLAGGFVGCGGGGGGEDSASPGGADTNPAVEITPAPAVAITPAPAVDNSGATAVSGAGGLVVLDAASSCALPDFRASLLQQINAARATARNCGSTAMPAASPLAWNDQLFSAAARQSRDMAQNNYFSHTSLDGRSHAQRIQAEGYASSGSGENIAAGQTSVSAVMDGWLASAGHCRNIMLAEYRDVAVSCVQQSGSTYGRYWTMLLARPR